jgi:hypothetical protein
MDEESSFESVTGLWPNICMDEDDDVKLNIFKITIKGKPGKVK